MDTESHHILIEAYDVNYELLNSESKIESILLDSLKESGATYITHAMHGFEPHGVSGFIMLAESHVSIHTWPEKNYAALDVFTCGDISMANKISDNLIEMINPGSADIDYIMRGDID